jgi:hypothetical protein
MDNSLFNIALHATNKLFKTRISWNMLNRCSTEKKHFYLQDPA